MNHRPILFLAKELEPVNEIYNLDNIEYFMEDPVCAQCGKLANSRCSRCKSEWYCSKECQIKRWKEHKNICKTLATLFKEENDLTKKKIEFNHIKVSGDQISQETSNDSDKLDLNKIKEENDQKLKKVLIEEIKEKKEGKNEDIKNDKKEEKDKDNNIEEKKNDNKEEKEKEKQKEKENELDDLD